MSNRLPALFAALLCWVAPLVHASDMTRLPPAVMRALSQSGVPAQNVSMFVADVATNEVLVELNGDTPRTPASTIKVLTSFVALDMLGPVYTWKTHAYIDGRLANGVLDGDLILVGEGDPYMTIERWWAFVRELRELGLERIKGDIVIDNTYFAPATGSRGDFDGQPHRSYNVLPDALLVNFQTSRFTIVPDSTGNRPQIVVNPLPANLQVKNRVKLGHGRCRGPNRSVSFIAQEETASEIVVAGTLAPTCGRYSATRAIMSAPEFAYGTFRTLWTESGGTIDGGPRIAKRSVEARHFHTFGSVPLSEVIRLINKFSNNVMARHLLLTLGAEKFGPPATPESGADAINDWLASRSIDIPGLYVENGSGLSRNERITARGLGEVLEVAWRSPYMPEFAASLPLAAMDGTLRNRFAGLQGRLRLKTGRIDDVSALAGFVHAASGKTFVLVVIINHPLAHFGVGEAVQTELVKWTASQ